MPGLRAKMGWSLIALGLACLASLSGAAAAPVRNDPTKYPPIAIHLVHSDDAACEHGCQDWLALEGPIGMGSASRFAVAVRRIGTRKVPILINSPGGSVQDALAMGRLIRARHLDVVVSKTVLDTCPAGSPHCAAPDRDGAVPGKPTTALAQCASACPFILAGGLHRYVPFGAYVGVHQFRSFETMTRVMRYYRVMTRMENGVRVEISRTLVSVKPVSSKRISIATPERSYGEVQRYLAAMGIAPSLMELAEATPTTSIRWLSLGELEATRLDTDGMNVAAFIEHLSVPGEKAGATKVVEKPVSQPDPTAPSSPPSSFENASIEAWTSDGALQGHLVGAATWTTEQHATGDAPAKPTLVATLDFGTLVGSLSIRADRPETTDSYLLTVTINAGPGDYLQDVTRIFQPVVSAKKDGPGTSLSGIIYQTEPNEFRIRLEPTASNAALLRNGSWISLTVQAKGARARRLLFQRGPSGMEATKQWLAAPLPQPAPPAPTVSATIADPVQARDDASLNAWAANGQLETHVDAGATWTAEDHSIGDTPAKPTLHAMLDFGPVIGSADIRIARATRSVEAYVVAVTIHPGTADYLQGLTWMDAPFLATEKDGPGETLSGVIHSPEPNEFRVLLDPTSANAALLRDKGWMLLTFQTADGRTRRVTLQPGPARSEAMKHWRDAPPPEPTPPAASAAVRDEASFEAWGANGRLEAHVDGGGTWMAEDHSIGDEPATSTLLATLDFGPLVGSMAVRAARATFGVEAYVLTVSIQPGSGDYLKDIVGMDEPFVSAEKDGSGRMLVGVVHPSDPGEFRVLLDPSRSNAALLGSGGWMAINLLTGDHRVRRVMFQRGPSGLEAMKHWLNRPKQIPSS